LEDFLFFSLYSFSCIAKQVTTLKTAPTLVLSWFPRNEPRASCPAFSITLVLPISPTPDLARYTYNEAAYNPVQILRNASPEACIDVNSLHGFWRQFHNPTFRTATYYHSKWGMLICQQSPVHSTNAQAQWPVCPSCLYGNDTLVICPAWLVQ
jgi:hypothetical protein